MNVLLSSNELKSPVNQDMAEMADTFAVFFGAWQSGWTLSECIWAASFYHPPPPFQDYRLTWNFGQFQQMTPQQIRASGVKGSACAHGTIV
jgi:hypothetical protein